MRRAAAREYRVPRFVQSKQIRAAVRGLVDRVWHLRYTDQAFMLLRRHHGGPRVRTTSALRVVVLSLATQLGCGHDRVIVKSDRTLTSAASEDATTRCGNGQLDLGESCDDNNTVSGDGCDSTCQLEDECGDQIVGPREECEPPGTSNCDAHCRRIINTCGNGILEQFEECED